MRSGAVGGAVARAFALSETRCHRSPRSSADDAVARGRAFPGESRVDERCRRRVRRPRGPRSKTPGSSGGSASALRAQQRWRRRGRARGRSVFERRRRGSAPSGLGGRCRSLGCGGGWPRSCLGCRCLWVARIGLRPASAVASSGGAASDVRQARPRVPQSPQARVQARMAVDSIRGGIGHQDLDVRARGFAVLEAQAPPRSAARRLEPPPPRWEPPPALRR